MPDLDQPDLATRAAQASTAPDFDVLVGRARRRRRTAVLSMGLAVAAVTAGVVAAVGTVNEGQAPVAPSPTTTQATTAPTTQPTTPTQPFQTVPGSGPCPPTRLVQLPPDSGCASLVHGDFDGDGLRDTLIVYRSPREGSFFLSAPPWRAMLVPARGAIQTLTLDGGDLKSNMMALATVDGNRDGRDDVLMELSRGASTDFVGILSDPFGRLGQVTLPNGAPVSVGFGGVVLFGNGGGCDLVNGEPQINWDGYFFHGGAWHWSRFRFRWTGIHALHAGHQGGIATERVARRYGEFHCFGIDWKQVIPPTRAW